MQVIPKTANELSKYKIERKKKSTKKNIKYKNKKKFCPNIKPSTLLDRSSYSPDP